MNLFCVGFLSHPMFIRLLNPVLKTLSELSIKPGGLFVHWISISYLVSYRCRFVLISIMCHYIFASFLRFQSNMGLLTSIVLCCTADLLFGHYSAIIQSQNLCLTLANFRILPLDSVFSCVL